MVLVCAEGLFSQTKGEGLAGQNRERNPAAGRPDEIHACGVDDICACGADDILAALGRQR